MNKRELALRGLVFTAANVHQAGRQALVSVRSLEIRLAAEAPRSRATHRAWMTLLWATLVVVACRRGPESHLVRPLPSCYRIAVGPWKFPPNARHPEQRYIPPTPQLLRLDPARSGLFRRARKDSPWGPLRANGDSAWRAFERGHPVRIWQIEGELLHAAFGTGNGGVSMYFRIVGDSLHGDIGPFTDWAIEYPRAPATGVRVSCPRL